MIRFRRTLMVACAVTFSTAAANAQPKRVVEVDDMNRDGRYTGLDIELALEKCRPGCRLRVGAHRYDDVAVVIDKRFPDGLEIEGAGVGKTVFRSPVPVKAPVFWLKGGSRGVVFRNFSLDGRKVEQTNASKISDSVGIRVSDLSRTPSDAGRIARSRSFSHRRNSDSRRSGMADPKQSHRRYRLPHEPALPTNARERRQSVRLG
jgi:hypothetical protein